MISLVDEARAALRWWSVQLAIVAGAIAGVITAHPDFLPTLLHAVLPENLRPIAPIFVALVTSGLPIAVRLLKQQGAANGQ
jgi:hypothetical protein